ncbi:MAG: phosphoglucosamine mutase [bacterium]
MMNSGGGKRSRAGDTPTTASESSPLMISVSGVRGIVGKPLTVEVVLAWARAFGTEMTPGPVVVGNDSRPSRDMMRSAVFAGLTSAGCNVLDLGIVPTPTIAMAVRHHRARGGIAITASHNPAAWNALKFFGPQGLFLNEEEGRRLQSAVKSGRFPSLTADVVGRIERDENAVSRHIDAILSIDLLDVRKLRARRFRVALDTVHGAGGVLLPRLLRELGCEVVPFHIEHNGHFPRNPEPVPENLAKLSKEVAAANVDIGFVVDPDADRLAVLFEDGKPAGEEMTLVVATDLVLRHRPGPVVTNVSTTRAMADVAARCGQIVLRTKVGEAHVAAKMLEIHAEIGGEGNGGVMFAPVHCVRDAGVGMALILQALLESQAKTSELFASMPHYVFLKERIEFPDIATGKALLKELPGKVNFGVPNELDGLKWEFDDGWVQVRASNTEPILRVFAEARKQERARKLAREVVKHLRFRPDP